MSNDNTTQQGLKDALKYSAELAVAGQEIREVQQFTMEDLRKNPVAVPFVVIPEGTKVQTLEHTIFHPNLPEPVRLEAKQQFTDVASFIAYVNRFKTPGTVIFFDHPRLTFAAILDYHVDAAQPRFCKHRAEYTIQRTRALNVWTEKNRKGMTQVEFAEFMEDNALDLVDAALMIQVSRNLQAKKSVEFRSDVRLDNGQVQLTYVENILGSTRNGDIEIPDSFEVRMPIFGGEAASVIKAKLRYNLTDGKLQMKYVLSNLRHLEDQRADEQVKLIALETGITPYL